MRFRFTFFLLLFHFCGQAQKEGQALIDSLLSALPKAENDTACVKILNRVCNYYAEANTDSAFKYTGIGMRLATKMKWDKAISVFNTSYGNIYRSEGKLDSSLYWHQRALEVSKKIHDSINEAVSYNNLGSVAEAKSDFVAAAQYFMHTLQLGKESKNNYNIAVACENLALVYQQQQDYVKGIEYARQAIAAYQLNNTPEELSGPLDLMGTFYLNLKQHDSACYYYQQALSNAQKSGDKIKEAAVLNSMAGFYANQQDYNNATRLGLQAKKIWDTVGPDFEDAINNTGLLGNYYLQTFKQAGTNKLNTSPQMPADKEKLLALATAYLNDAVEKCKEKGNKNSQSEFQHYLAEANALAGNYKDAYLNYKSYQEIKDSVYSQENKNKIAAAMSKLELDKKNAEIAINQLTISNQRKQQVFFISGLFLLVVIGGLLYWQNRTRKKTNTTLLSLNSKLDEANKVKAKFFAILSHDLRSPVANLISFLRLQKKNPGLLSEQQKQDAEQKITVTAESLLETMETMLLWSKGQMENFKPQMQTVTANKLFNYLDKLFSSNEKIKLVFTNPQDLTFTSDENYLQTIMYNLTSNAVKALANTNDAIIEWKAFQREGKTILSITDNGPGLSKESMDKLYNETTVANTSTGLGLHLVRDLAKAIQCDISVQSKLREGTTFSLFG